MTARRFSNQVDQVDADESTPRPSGDCFQRAGWYALKNCDMPGLFVVHGKVRDSWPPHAMIDHAWCEVPGVATVVDDDGTNRREIDITVVVDHTQRDAPYLPTEMFYSATGAVVTGRWTFREYVDTVLAHGNDGPWNE
jgi:hypothetical protein